MTQSLDTESANPNVMPAKAGIQKRFLKSVVAYPDQSVRDAMAQLGGRDVGRIPVVDRNDLKRLLGVLRRHDVVRACTKAVDNKTVLRKSDKGKI